MSDRKSRIFATIVIILIVVVISFLFMTRENYVRYSFYDATGCQYIEVTKMENAKGENSIKHLSLYKYGYFMAYNDDNDLLFTIREYAGDIVKIEVATKTEYYRYIARN